MQNRRRVLSHVLLSPRIAYPTAPTPTLQRLEVAASNARVQVQFEQTNTAVVQQVAQLFASAREHYYRSMRALQGAQRTNRGAQVNNLLGGRNGGMEMVETMQNIRRNNLMQEAQGEAQARARRELAHITT